MNKQRILRSKKILVVLITFVLLLVFYLGFKSGIHLRASLDRRLIPKLNQHYAKYKKSKSINIFLDGFIKYLSLTKAEYKDIVMEACFEYETKPWMKWIINKQLSQNDTVLDIGGATGIQWKIFKDKVESKNLRVIVTDINKHSLELGKKNNSSKRVTFKSIEELDSMNEKIDKILLCGVYMQMKNGNMIIKDYLDKYPNAEFIIVHSVFPNTLGTKILSFFKKYFFKYTYLAEMSGRAITQYDFNKEMKSAGLQIKEEYNLTHISNYKRVNNDLKAFIVVKS